MTKYATPKFRPDQKAVRVDSGQEGTILRVRKRVKWSMFHVPEYRIKFPNGEQVVREDNLALAPPKADNGGEPDGTSEKHALPAVGGTPGSGRAFTSVLTVVATPPQPEAGPQKTDRWPATPEDGTLPQIAVTSYRRPGP